MQNPTSGQVWSEGQGHSQGQMSNHAWSIILQCLMNFDETWYRYSPRGPDVQNSHFHKTSLWCKYKVPSLSLSQNIVLTSLGEFPLMTLKLGQGYQYADPPRSS